MPLQGLGLLYGSAAANLLRNDGPRQRRATPHRVAAIEYGVEVVRFVIEHMPARRWVVCLGRQAWEVASAAVGVEGDWQVHRDSGERFGPLVAAYYPSARVAWDRMAGPWEILVRAAA